MYKKNFNEKGFTLIEVITALSVFAVIMTISMGSIVGIFDANRKSESLKTVMDNMNFTMEAMAREMRFGKNYHCGSGSPTIPFSCPTGNNGANTLMSFIDQSNNQITYTLVGSGIQKSSSAAQGGTFIEVTAPEVTITNLRFFVVGAESYASGDRQQPRVLMFIQGYAGSKPTSKTTFTLQTTVTQRLRDN